MKGIVSVTYTDGAANTYNKNLPNVNPAYLPTYGVDVAESDVAKVKTATLALFSLSNCTANAINLSIEMNITNVTGGENNG